MCLSLLFIIDLHNDLHCRVSMTLSLKRIRRDTLTAVQDCVFEIKLGIPYVLERKSISNFSLAISNITFEMSFPTI